MKEKSTEKKIRFDKYNSQAMKRIAIILMLLHHMYLSPKRFEGYDISFAPFSASTVIYTCSFFKICVSLYVLISGYGLYLSYKNNQSTPCRWTAKRLIKTMSGFWIIWILSAVIFQFMFGYVSKIYFTDESITQSLAAMGLDFLGLAKLFGTVSMNNTWWYMSAAIIFIICMPVFMKNEDNLIPILLIISAIPRMLGLKVIGRTEIYAYLPIFIMGMCIAKYDVYNRWFQVWNKGIKKVIKLLLELIVLYILYKAYGELLPVEVYGEVRWGIIPIVFMAVCGEFITVIPGIHQILLFLGKHSMNIFLVHTFIRQHFWKDYVYGNGHFMVNFLVLIVPSIAISIVLEWLKKVTGYNRLIQNICAKIG